jgi:hypothetical protein
MFIHFGTSREYWETVAADAALQRICGWVRTQQPGHPAKLSSLFDQRGS